MKRLAVALLAAMCALAIPVAAQGQEIGVYLSATRDLSDVEIRQLLPIQRQLPDGGYETRAPIRDVYRPLGFVIVATYYTQRWDWFGVTGDIGYARDTIEHPEGFESRISTITTLLGVRFRPPGSKDWDLQPSASLYVSGRMDYRSQTDDGGILKRNGTLIAYGVAAALNYEFMPGKAISAQVNSLIMAGGMRPLRVALGTVFTF